MAGDVGASGGLPWRRSSSGSSPCPGAGLDGCSLSPCWTSPWFRLQKGQNFGRLVLWESAVTNSGATRLLLILLVWCCWRNLWGQVHVNPLEALLGKNHPSRSKTTIQKKKSHTYPDLIAIKSLLIRDGKYNSFHDFIFISLSGYKR